MKKGLLLVFGLLVASVLLTGGCFGHPKGMESLRWLAEAEKEKVIEIALNTSAAEEASETYGVYTTELRWVGIFWFKGKAVLWEMDYDSVEYWLPGDASESFQFYSQVVIDFGEPPQEELRVAVNPDTGKIANITKYRFGTSPATE
jgi:hypothetical protein